MVDQPTRQAILSVLEEKGGAYKTALKDELGRGWGNLGHHLRILERQGAVDLERHGTRLWAFRPDVPDEHRRIIIALGNESRLNVLRHLDSGEASTIRDLSEKLEYSHKMIRTHLSHLMDVGAVERRGTKPHVYAPRRRFLGRFHRNR